MDSRLVMGAVLAAALVLWWSDHRAAEGRAELLTVQRDHAAQAADERAATVATQREQLAQLAEVGAELTRFRQTLARQGEEQARQLKELKAHDQAAALWLAAGVPASVGRLFVYPETTDPDAYRPLPADPVPAAGPVGADD
ncbi:hypothetical protein D3C81_318110 [compost metagenome]